MFTASDYDLVKTINKRAFERSWQKNPLTTEQYSDWRADKGNTVGIITGGKGFIFVIDIDLDKYLNDINDQTTEWILKHLEPTLIVETPSGGFHYYYRADESSYPEAGLRRKIRPFGDAITIDLLGEGGYANCPLDAKGGYSQYKLEHISPLPEALAVLWHELSIEKEHIDADDDGVSDIPEGRRNDVMYRSACRYRAQSLNQREIGLLLWDENERRCKPLLSREEIWLLAGNACKFEPGHESEAERSREGVLPFETISELRVRAAEMDKPEVVCGPFQSGTWGIIAGPPGVGKSMFTSALARAITMGSGLSDWGSPKKRKVAIIDAEMTPAEIDPRIPLEIPDRLIYCTIDLLDREGRIPFSLGSSNDQQGLIAACVDVDVIIIDNIEYTLEAAPGRDVFHPETWAQVAPLTRWAKAANKCLIFIDHTNAAGGVQGSLSKQRGASFVVSLQPEFREHAALCFSVGFSKLRYQVENNLKARRTWWLDDMGWHSEQELNVKDQIIELIKEGLIPTQIIKEIDATRAFVYRVYKQNKHLKPTS